MYFIFVDYRFCTIKKIKLFYAAFREEDEKYNIKTYTHRPELDTYIHITLYRRFIGFARVPL